MFRIFSFAFFALLTLTVTMNAQESKSALATVGGGCFWCVEAVYETVPGIQSVTSGYAGGESENPSYKDVSTGKSGHAEVVQIAYDPELISYDKIIDLFWKAHDPTTLNRQGADRGSQYRSIILYGNEAEKAAAEKSKTAAQAEFKDPIVTEIVPLTTFYPAEDYHQDFYQNNPDHPYNQAVTRTKVEKFKKATGGVAGDE